MPTRRKTAQLQLSIVLSVLIATAPCSVSISDYSIGFSLQTALAKNGNNGNGGGNNNGGGNGDGGGNGNKGGKNDTPGNSNSQGAKDKGVTTKGSPASLSVRHDDGISEIVRNGRYIMKDSKGRTIVNRRATLGDEIRLRFFRR